MIRLSRAPSTALAGPSPRCSEESCNERRVNAGSAWLDPEGWLIRFGSYGQLQIAHKWGENCATMHRCGIIILALLASGCDPIINVYGSFFPAWVVCLVVGLRFTVLLRLVFAVTHVERYLGPLILIYPSLTLLLTLVTWLVFFQT